MDFFSIHTLHVCVSTKMPASLLFVTIKRFKKSNQNQHNSCLRVLKQITVCPMKVKPKVNKYIFGLGENNRD